MMVKERVALGLGILLIVVSFVGMTLMLGSPMEASADITRGMMGQWGSMREMMAACASAMVQAGGN